MHVVVAYLWSHNFLAMTWREDKLDSIHFVIQSKSENRYAYENNLV
jgi:hypothetical protein